MNFFVKPVTRNTLQFRIDRIQSSNSSIFAYRCLCRNEFRMSIGSLSFVILWNTYDIVPLINHHWPHDIGHIQETCSCFVFMFIKQLYLDKLLSFWSSYKTFFQNPCFYRLNWSINQKILHSFYLRSIFIRSGQQPQHICRCRHSHRREFINLWLGCLEKCF